MPKQPPEVDALHRQQAAEHEFAALCRRHRVRVAIETGQSTETGPFTRILFLALPRLALEPKKPTP